GGGLVNDHTFERILLWEHAERVRSGELVELAPLLVLCEDKPAREALEEERELIRAASVPREVRVELEAVAYLLGLRYLSEGIVRAVFREELSMIKESPLISSWIEEARASGEVTGETRGEAQASRRARLVL